MNRKRFYLLFTVGWITIVTNAQSNKTDSLKQLLTQEKTPSTQFELLTKLCEEFRFISPDSTLFYANRAVTIANQLKDTNYLVRAEFYIATFYYSTGNSDKAFLLAQKNIQWIEKKSIQQDLLAQYYSFSGLCLMKMDRQKEALERFYKALRLAEQTTDYLTQIRALSNIGWVMMELNQFENATSRFRQAINLMNTHLVSVKNIGTIYNNLASSFGSLNKLDSAKKYSELAIDASKLNNDIYSQANAYFILGTTYEKKGQLQNALDIFNQAQPLREQIGDPFYIVSDLSEIATLYAKLNRNEEGIETSKKALSIAEKNKLTAKLPMILHSLATNYEGKGDFKNASIIYKKLGDLKDSLYNDANPKALAEMAAKYETEKKEQQILLQKSELSKKNLTIAAISVLVLLASLLTYSFYRRYRLKQKTAMQAEMLRQQEISTRAVLEAEERERQRIAKDLHDGVGQIMSAAKMNLSAFENELLFNTPELRLKFEKIIALVDESCKEVRSVSHNMMPNALLKMGLAAAIREFTDKIDHKMIRIDLHSEGLNERLDTNLETILYRIIQECVNNVLKHAKANQLDISLIKDIDGISATIEDNGKGFDTSDQRNFDGLGLKNIRTRVEYLRGTVEYDSKKGKGTLVAIHIPAVI